jgi:hypothetical protein
MAEATITLKLTPREFDLIRQELRSSADSAKMIVTDRDTDARTRSEQRQRAAELENFLTRLK